MNAQIQEAYFNTPEPAGFSLSVYETLCEGLDPRQREFLAALVDEMGREAIEGYRYYFQEGWRAGRKVAEP